ncbi:hypothetical protein C7180_24010 [Salmonella enterica]|nr:hypothetical protein [Salmonella enterica]
MKLFAKQKFYLRSSTSSFGAKEFTHPHLELEQRAVFVYDLITDENFDIDKPFYFYPRELQLEPWSVKEEEWSTVAKPGYHELLPGNKMLPLKPTSPHSIVGSYMVPDEILK